MKKFWRKVLSGVVWQPAQRIAFNRVKIIYPDGDVVRLDSWEDALETVRLRVVLGEALQNVGFGD